MYFVDREKIEERLVFLENQLSLLVSKEKWSTEIEIAALERVCHTIIESILDVGNAMIDGFIMRDPGSYDDIIDILDDEKVITKEMGEGLKTIVRYRKKLVQEYTEINHADLLSMFLHQVQILKDFAPRVRKYLTDELGPVSAFKN